MPRTSLLAFVCLWSLFAGLQASAAPPQGGSKATSATIRRVAVLGKGNDVELEITASQPVVPQTQVLSGPDRLVIDFPGAAPGPDLHPLSLDRGEVKAVRVGLFGSSPRVTRVVVDLKTAQQFQVFPSGNTVLVKIGSAHAAVVNAVEISRTPVVQPEETSFIGTVVSGNPQIQPLPVRSNMQVAIPPVPQQPSLVTFKNGLLRVNAQNATLAQVLFEVQQQTGADIGVPSGAAQEHIVVDLGPAPPKEVMAALLNGSPYNFIILGSESDAGSLGRVILTPKAPGAADETYIAPQAAGAAQVPEPQPEPQAVMPAPQMPPDQNNVPQAEPQPN